MDALSVDFDPYIASIMSRKESYTINEIEALLLAKKNIMPKTTILIISPFLLLLILLPELLCVQLLTYSIESLFTLVVAVASCVFLRTKDFVIQTTYCKTMDLGILGTHHVPFVKSTRNLDTLRSFLATVYSSIFK